MDDEARCSESHVCTTLFPPNHKITRCDITGARNIELYKVDHSSRSKTNGTCYALISHES